MRAEPGLLVALIAVAPAPAADGRLPFADVAGERGLAFHHDRGDSGRRYIVEITGSGGGFLDYDGDGDLDVLLIDGGSLAEEPGSDRGRARLFANDGSGYFSDVSKTLELGTGGYGMGLAVGDVDGDGDPDLLLTRYGRDLFLRNRGGGEFEDATDEAGLGDSRWTTSASFLDYDRDGDLDLYVAGYVDFDPARFVPCTARGVEVHCGPDRYDGISDRLYANDGTGRFRDVSEETGIAAFRGKGLGVAVGDVDDDGDPDVYVANDRTANLLFLNRLDRGEAVFEEDGEFLGVAYGAQARAESGMGADLGDFDGDGDLDAVCTNLDAETNSLYRNDDGGFVESSYLSGLGAISLPWVGFGVRFLDYDLDGDLDLFVANGHIMDNVSEIREGIRFEQPDLLLSNQEGRFVDTCPGCFSTGAGRGLAAGDFDDDGDVDLLVTNNGGPPALLENTAPRSGSAIGISLEGSGSRSNRDAYGARVALQVGSVRQVREVGAGGSFCSSHDPRVLLSVPPDVEQAEVRVTWPDGEMETYVLRPGAYHHVVQGKGVTGRTPFAGSSLRP
jgi:hypothetical protein